MLKQFSEQFKVEAMKMVLNEKKSQNQRKTVTSFSVSPRFACFCITSKKGSAMKYLPLLQKNMSRMMAAFGGGISVLFLLILVFFWEQTRSLEFILYLQQFRLTPEDVLFRIFTFLGSNQFFMIFFGILIWCVNKELGFWTGMVLLLSALCSGILKDLTNLPRPAIPEVVHPPSIAFPSGHAMSGVNFWGYLAVKLDKPVFWVWTVIAVAMISFSRLILGYHFLGDVLGGIALGIPCLLVLTAAFANPWLNKPLPLVEKLVLIAAYPYRLPCFS